MCRYDKPIIQILGPNPKIFRVATIEPKLPLPEEEEEEEGSASAMNYTIEAT
jgi:hypothetical protein